jgi:hypothetical protein
MALLAERKHGRASFLEQDYFAFLERPVTSSGVLIYEAPDRFVKRTLRPRRASLELDDGLVTVRRGGRRYHFDLSSDPEVAPDLDALRATLAGDRAALERAFDVRFEGSLAHWRLTLTPRAAPIARRLRAIRIAGLREDIHSIVILESNGDRSVMTLGPPPPSPSP